MVTPRVLNEMRFHRWWVELCECLRHATPLVMALMVREVKLRGWHVLCDSTTTVGLIDRTPSLVWWRVQRRLAWHGRREGCQ